MAKALIVDDEEDIAKIASRMIKFYHPEMSVEIYTDSAQASEILSKNIKDYSFAIFDMDFKNQKMQGLELIANTRKISETFPIIAYSGNLYNKDEALSKGASEFISKPFEMEDFNAVISKYLKNQK